MKKKQIIVGRKINDDLSYDKYLDDLIENDIVDLEETFFTCFHKQLNDNNDSGNNMVDTIDKNGDDNKKRITKNMMNRNDHYLINRQQKMNRHRLQKQIETAENIIEKYRIENIELKQRMKTSAMKIESESKHLFVNIFNDILKEEE